MSRKWKRVLCPVMLALAACGGAGESGVTAIETTTPASTTIHPPAFPTSTVPESAASTAVSGLVYMAGDERFRDAQELLEVVVPADSGGPWPVVVVLHGDPGVAGRQWSMPMATELAGLGRVVFVPDWGHTTAQWQSEGTLREQFDSLVAELRCAVAAARATASDYGGDPDHLTVMGYSAGANAALMAAMSDIEPSEFCVVSGPGVSPQAVVAIEGDLLIGAPQWDQELADDPDSFYSFSPWRWLNTNDEFPVHILAVTNALSRTTGSDPQGSFLATRHTDIDLIAELEGMGILDDGSLSSTEANQWAYQTLLDAGYTTTFALLSDSRHAMAGDRNWAMSDQAWQLAIDTVLNAEHPTR